MLFIKGLFATLKSNLQESNSYEKFNDQVFSNLERQDALRNYQQYEKKLTKEIRDLKQKYNSVDVEFKNEKEEKQKSIEKFKKSRIKAQKEADVTRNY